MHYNAPSDQSIPAGQPLMKLIQRLHPIREIAGEGCPNTQDLDEAPMYEDVLVSLCEWVHIDAALRAVGLDGGSAESVPA